MFGRTIELRSKSGRRSVLADMASESSIGFILGGGAQWSHELCSRMRGITVSGNFFSCHPILANSNPILTTVILPNARCKVSETAPTLTRPHAKRPHHVKEF